MFNIKCIEDKWENGWQRWATYSVSKNGELLGYFTEFYSYGGHTTYCNLPAECSYFLGSNLSHTAAANFIVELKNRKLKNV